MHKMSKRVVLALVCAVAMMASMISVSAAGNAARRAGHVHVYVPEGSGTLIGKPVSQDSDYHMASYRVKMKCQTTGCNESYTTTENRLESHSWSDAVDLGHMGKEEHAFRLKCGECEGNKEVRILCEYNSTGWHNTPW